MKNLLFITDVKKRKKTVCIDLDGTLCQEQKFGYGIITGQPKASASRALQELKKEGFKIVILTTRLNPSFGGDIEWKKNEVERWLKDWEIPFDEVTNNKPPADLYIDNKAIRFFDWEEAVRILKPQTSNSHLQ